MQLDLLKVGGAQRTRLGGQFAVAFESFELGDGCYRQIKLVRIEHPYQRQIVPAVGESIDGTLKFLWIGLDCPCQSSG